MYQAPFVHSPDEASGGPVEAPPKPAEGGGEEERFVPISELSKLRKELKARDKRDAERDAADAEREKAKLSETERLKAENDELLRKHQESEKQIMHDKRAGLIRDAAAKMKFANTNDAVKFADLAGIEDRDDAERFIKSLARSHPYLLATEKAPSDLQKVTNGFVSDSDTRQYDPAQAEHAARKQEGKAVWDVIQKAQARLQ